MSRIRRANLIKSLNDLFADENLTDADQVGLFNHVVAHMMTNEDLVQQARANNRDQFIQSPTLIEVGKDATIAAMDSYGVMTKKLFGDKAKLDNFLALLAPHFYDIINREQPPAAP